MSAIWQFNTRTFVRAIVQYTDVSRNPDLYEDEVAGLDRDFFVQLLFSYKVNPQTVAFLGYSEGGQQTDEIRDDHDRPRGVRKDRLCLAVVIVPGELNVLGIRRQTKKPTSAIAPARMNTH